jgi:hypothetical protein
MEPIDKKRSTDLIAIFEDGFAVNWFMAVRECFKDKLDIKLTERKKDKISYLQWTQGPYFSFSEGHTFYDTKLAYSNWVLAVSNTKIAYQVMEAKRNEPSMPDGYVKFVVFKPNVNRDRLIPFVGYKVTQNEFVNLLKYGDDRLNMSEIDYV